MINFYQNFNLLGSELINFVNLAPDQRELVRNWRNHPEIKKWMRRDHIISRDEHLGFIERLKSDKKNFYWLVKDNGRNIGVIYLNNVDFKNKTAHLGIYVNPDILGVGSKLIGFLKELSFGVGGLSSLKLEVMENNLRAINFYKKHGFVLDDNKKGALILRDGKQIQEIIMGLDYAHKN